jgi:hypothetical protein
MNIAMASYYLPPQDRIGAGYMQHYLANAYVRAGHRVTMFSPVEERADDSLYHLAPIRVQGSNRFLKFAWNLRNQDYIREANPSCSLANRGPTTSPLITVHAWQKPYTPSA